MMKTLFAISLFTAISGSAFADDLNCTVTGMASSSLSYKNGTVVLVVSGRAYKAVTVKETIENGSVTLSFDRFVLGSLNAAGSVDLYQISVSLTGAEITGNERVKSESGSDLWSPVRYALKCSQSAGFTAKVASTRKKAAVSQQPEGKSEQFPKYGPQATRLYDSRRYVLNYAAPDFWAMMPYYLPQKNDRSCSIASFTMVLNAARANDQLSASDELGTQLGILDLSRVDEWKRAVGDDDGVEHGVALDTYASFALQGLKAYGFNNATVEVVHADNSPATNARIYEILYENENSADDFVVANFLQSEFTGDPDGAVGHLSPVGAYDRRTGRVLIMDTDRRYYEPYWVLDETFLKGMHTKDTSMDRYRGLIYIRLNREEQ